jgi:hypothetical protein
MTLLRIDRKSTSRQWLLGAIIVLGVAGSIAVFEEDKPTNSPAPTPALQASLARPVEPHEQLPQLRLDMSLAHTPLTQLV